MCSVFFLHLRTRALPGGCGESAFKKSDVSKHFGANASIACKSRSQIWNSAAALDTLVLPFSGRYGSMSTRGSRESGRDPCAETAAELEDNVTFSSGTHHVLRADALKSDMQKSSGGASPEAKPRGS